MSNINYSIIIPHKNIPQLLQRCLDSIPIRDDVQVIVVDDNSDADKVDFNNFPKWRGTNYEYYLTKEGKGAGYARNVGLEHAKGKWVLFIDADDYILPCINQIMDEYIDTENDIIYFYPMSVLLKDRSTLSKRADGYVKVLNKCITTQNRAELILTSGSPWSKLIKLDLINQHNIKFDEIKYSNDLFFSTKSAIKANKNKIKIDKRCYYVITQGENSLTSHFLTKEGELECRSKAFLHSYKYAFKYGYDCSDAHDYAKFILHKLYGKNWRLYSEYFIFLNKLGEGIIPLLRNEFSYLPRNKRWLKYM